MKGWTEAFEKQRCAPDLWRRVRYFSLIRDGKLKAVVYHCHWDDKWEAYAFGAANSMLYCGSFDTLEQAQNQIK